MAQKHSAPGSTAQTASSRPRTTKSKKATPSPARVSVTFFRLDLNRPALDKARGAAGGFVEALPFLMQTFAQGLGGLGPDQPPPPHEEGCGDPDCGGPGHCAGKAVH